MEAGFIIIIIVSIIWLICGLIAFEINRRAFKDTPESLKYISDFAGIYLGMLGVIGILIALIIYCVETEKKEE